MNKAFFFDRDGIVNKRIIDGYIDDPKNLEIFPETCRILSILKNNSYLLILVTNQQGVGKKLMTLESLHVIHNELQTYLEKNFNVKFDDIFYCTDLAQTNSYYRKPNPGMILDAAKKWNIDLSLSYMVGDSESDILAGKNANVKTIYINSEKINIKPDYHFNTLIDFEFAVKNII